MKKAFLTLLFLIWLALPARAQIGNTTPILFPGAPSGTCAPLSFGINTATGALYYCVAGVWTAVGGAGGSPANPSGSLQYNTGGAFGAVPVIEAGNADCDGFMDPCALQYVDADTFGYIIYGTSAMGPMGNFHDFYNFMGTWSLDSSDGTISGNLTLGPTTGSLTNGFNATYAGFETKQDFLGVGFSRFMFYMKTGQIPVAGDFALSAGWGTTASVTAVRGADNNPKVTVESSGTGQGANPTIAFTYHNGAFGNTSNVPTFVCQMSDGTGVVADITHVESTTVLTMTYNAIPVAGLTYTISCFGATAGDN